jgi:eukaryotic-like serine/threonine-protein kinase
VSKASESTPLVGQLLDGRYQIVREIASGGMSAVYEATHVKIGRTVAIKVLHREMAGDPEVVTRFLNEARAVGTFGHPNIVASTDFGELAGHVPYLVLEYLEGHTLGHEVQTEGPLPIRRVVRIALQIASALEAAHARDVIHRDLTSANIFLVQREGRPDHVKVLDFGISKFMAAEYASPKTRRGLTMGTPEFMSPEQISDPDSVDARVDVYGLGVIMYQMLAGQCPFTRMPLQSLLTQIVIEPPPPIERGGIPEELQAIVTKALSKSPGDRYARMCDLGFELERLAAQIFSGADWGGPVAMMDSGARSGGLAPSGTQGQPTTVTSTSGSISPGALSSSGALLVPSTSTSGPLATPPPPLTDPTLATRGRGLTFVALALALASASAVGFLLLRPQHQETPAPAPQAAPAPSSSTVPAPRPPAPVHLKLTSPAPEARVTLRGRTHLLPFEEAVSAGAQPEVVEITAPGREGRRYWLTLDHPIALASQLPAGHGVVEATEEQTVIALGGKAIEAAPAAAQEREPNEETPSSGTPRHTGGHRHGGALKPAKATMSADRSAAEPAAAPSAPAAAAPAPGTIPALTKPEAAPALKPASAVAGKTDAPASIRPKVVSGVDPVKTQVFVRSHLGEVQRCYERGKMDDPDLKGRVTLKIFIAETGAVTSAMVDSSSLRSSVVEDCIATTVKDWKFPAPVGGAAVISYPFNLK